MRVWSSALQQLTGDVTGPAVGLIAALHLSTTDRILSRASHDRGNQMFALPQNEQVAHAELQQGKNGNCPTLSTRTGRRLRFCPKTVPGIRSLLHDSPVGKGRHSMDADVCVGARTAWGEGSQHNTKENCLLMLQGVRGLRLGDCHGAIDCLWECDSKQLLGMKAAEQGQ